MRLVIPAIAIFFLTTVQARADSPGVEYFVIKSEKLRQRVPNDEQMDEVNSSQLEQLSEVHGHVERVRDASVFFATKSIRVDVRLSVFSLQPDDPITEIRYSISSGGPKDWKIVSVGGIASKIGNSFITKDWRSKPFVVVMRYINFKH